ncbi:MAG: beta-ketoacyl synthase [Gammaproteobacteria bacterium]|nr:beta-ketoacyl synthase [Gammaproteobacteria bacterium]
MTNLPVIVGFGGYNASGRSSFHHGYRRTVFESLSEDKKLSTLLSLASLMKLVRFENGVYIDIEEITLTPEQVREKYEKMILENTLIRRITRDHFDVDNVPSTKDMRLESDHTTEFTLSKKELPNPVPANWQVNTLDDKYVSVAISGGISMKMESFREFDVQSAGILPSGFKPSDEYNSRFHPRGLQLSILGASDAINSMGISWEDLMQVVSPDEVAVFASSGLGQTDDHGVGGYMQARLRSGRASSKQMALGLNSMPADFINAYVCGSVGTTGATTGACASFLYNLRLGVDDIKAGRHRVAICGCSEAPVTPEVMEGFAAMSALGTDERLAALDGTELADHRKASRPFGENAGFTMGESTQYFIVMDDALAVELGLEVYGAVTDVFVNADGFKKSISSPGAGNYVTVAKAVASAISIVGEDSVKNRSFIQAHGSSTPQNRITESMIFDKVASAFDITDWPVTAVKAFVAHPLGPASGDQLANTLGVFADGIIPGIKTTSKVADDVLDERLNILLDDYEASMDVAFLNSKGFGGNNATATVLSPNVAMSMIEKRVGAEVFESYMVRMNNNKESAKVYDLGASQGDLNVLYNFGSNIIEDHEIEVEKGFIAIDKFSNKISLDFDNPFKDMV